MKTIIIASILLIAMFATFAMAEEVVLGVGDAVAVLNETTTTLTETITTTAVPEITTTLTDTTVTTLTEDNPEDVETETASGLKIGWQRAKIALTFNQEKKAMEELKLAKLRLIQARIAAKKGNEKAMNKALEAHDRIIERLQERIKKMDGAKDETGIRNSAEKFRGLARAIEVHQQRIEIVKQRLAKENLTAEQKVRIEEKLAKMENNTQKLTELQEAKREQLKTKLMAVSGKTEQEAEEIIADKEKAKENREKLREQRQTEVENETEVEAENETEDKAKNETED